MALTRNLALRTLAEVLAKAISALFVIVCARRLPVAEFGQFALSWAAGWVAATACDLGTHVVVVREISRHPGDRASIVGSGLGAKTVLLAAVAVVALAVGLVTDVSDPVVFIGVGGSVVLLGVVDFVQHVARADGRFGRDASMQLVARAAIATAGLVGLSRGGIRALAIGMVVAAAACAATAVTVMVATSNESVFRGDVGTRTRRLLVESLPVGIGVALSIACFRLDVFVLDAYRGAAAVGLYSAGYRIFEAAQIVPAIIVSALFPRLASTALQERGRPLRVRATLALAACGAAVAIVLWLVASQLVPLVFGEMYAEAALPLRILAAAVPLMFVNYLLTHDLIATGRQVAFAVIAGIALALNLASNVAVVPRFGIPAAAVVTVGTELVLLVLCLAALRGRPAVAPGVLREEAA